MANKYIIHGATFDGDGTTSSPAASDGAAGAWNSFENVVENSLTYGSYAAGDVIYCATNDGSSDIGFSMTGDLNFTTFEAPDSTVTLWFDDGTNVGSAGTFTLTRNVAQDIETNGWVVKGNNRLVINNTRNTTEILMINSGEVHDTKIKINGGWPRIAADGYIKSLFKNITVEIINSSTTTNEFFSTSNGAYAEYINIIIDFSGNSMTSLGNLFLPYQNQGGSQYIRGLSITNDSSTPVNLFKEYDINTATGRPKFIEIEGLDVGSHYTESFFMPPPVDESANRFNSGRLAVLGGISRTDAGWSMHHGYCTWIQGKNYPTLNALLLDGVTNWSWRCFPRYVYPYNPLICPPVRKLYEDTAATKTITMELLVEDSVTNVDDWHIWLEIDYVDNATDSLVTETTRCDLPGSATTLTTSTAGWSSTTYGALSYDKYKITHTTSNSIKQDTEIIVRLYIGASVGTDTKFWFFDPDVSVS